MQESDASENLKADTDESGRELKENKNKKRKKTKVEDEELDRDPESTGRLLDTIV